MNSNIDRALTRYSMKIILAVLLLIILVGCSSRTIDKSVNDQSSSADSLYMNGRIYTVNNIHPWAQAIAVRDKEIIYVGDNETSKAYIGTTTDVIDLKGQMVMPGIHDAHTHLVWAGLHKKFGCKLAADLNVNILIAQLKNCERGLADDQWIIGSLFFTNQFPDGKPNKSYLDEAFPDRPVYLNEGSLHHALVNSKALELAGIDEESLNPHGGEFVKDENGQLTGELVETATALISRHIPLTSLADNIEALQWAIETNNKFGITSVQDASGDLILLEALSAIENTGNLTLNVDAHIMWHSPNFNHMSDDQVERLIRDRKKYQSDHLNPNNIKMWIDGSPTPPYFTEAGLEGDFTPDEKWVLITPSVLNKAVTRFDALGMRVKMHASGAGSAHIVLDAIEAARMANANTTISHELAHTNLLAPSDMQRMEGLNTIAEMSPAVWHLYGRLLGNPPQKAWEFKKLQELGVTMTVGTDWGVSDDPNLFPALEGMLYHGDDSIDLKAAIETVTINGATALGIEKKSGSLEAGKWANFIVLDRNIFEVEPKNIGQVRVLKTVFEGKVVYESGL